MEKVTSSALRTQAAAAAATQDLCKISSQYQANTGSLPLLVGAPTLTRYSAYTWLSVT